MTSGESARKKMRTARLEAVEGPVPDKSPGAPKSRFEVPGTEILHKTVTISGKSGRVYLPRRWVGARVKIIRID